MAALHDITLQITMPWRELRNVWKKIPKEFLNVFDADTDGYQFTNFLNLDPKELLNDINKELEVINYNSSIRLEFSEAYSAIILTKKKYLHLKRLITFNDLLQDLNQDILLKCQISHKGYERNASIYVKRIFNYIGSLTFFIAKYFSTTDKALQYLDFEIIIYAIFFYLMKQEQTAMYENVQLNKHKNESNRQRYIDSHTTTYVGNIKTVLLCMAGIHRKINIFLLNSLPNSRKNTKFIMENIYETM